MPVALGFLVVGAAAPSPAIAQPVVQPLPPPEVGALDAALRRLAADPRNVQALVDAGYAALALNDADAAIGFFSRASEIAPSSAKAKAGLGSAFVRSENPYDAMLLFEEALRLGASPASLAADRGLASDLVGDSNGAQTFYRQALASGPNPEVTRRLALSLAVSGKRNEMEDVLLPLLKKSDLSAFRTRAFGLAILGDTKEASEIADAVMPKEMARRIKPYFKQLPRLTPAQQIAAASFGHFPAEKNIGSDDPRVARYGGASKAAAAAEPVRTADASLIPAGEPLGAKGKMATAGNPARNIREDRGSTRRGQQLAVATEPTRTIPRSSVPALAPASPARTAPAAPLSPSGELAPVSPQPGYSSPAPQPGFSPAVATPAPQPAPPPAKPGFAPSPAKPGFAPSSSPSPLPAPSQPTLEQVAAKAAAATPALPAATFDLRTLPQSTSSAAVPTAAPATQTSSALMSVVNSQTPAAPVPSTQAPAGLSPAAQTTLTQPAAATPIYTPPSSGQPAMAAAAPPPEPEQKFGSVEDAFAGFATTTPPVTVLPGAVDLTTIKVAREAPPAPKPDPKIAAAEAAKDKAAKDKLAKGKLAKDKLAKDKVAKEKAEKEKARKANPSRIWVQVGTGRDKSALGFTWRKMNKDDAALFKGRKPYVADWGQTNRLLTGPFPSDAAAKDFLKKLKAAKYDSFAFTSDDGEIVELLPTSR